MARQAGADSRSLSEAEPGRKRSRRWLRGEKIRGRGTPAPKRSDVSGDGGPAPGWPARPPATRGECPRPALPRLASGTTAVGGGRGRTANEGERHARYPDGSVSPGGQWSGGPCPRRRPGARGRARRSPPRQPRRALAARWRRPSPPASTSSSGISPVCAPPSAGGRIRLAVAEASLLGGYARDVRDALAALRDAGTGVVSVRAGERPAPPCAVDGGGVVLRLIW